jgi:ribose transport system substrate-binding protein
MHRHFCGLAIAGLTTAAMLGVASTGSAQDKGGYQGVPRTFLWANGPIEFTDTAQYKKDPPYVIGFSNASVSNIWRVGMQHAIEAAAARHADKIDKLIITDANDDPAKQAADIQDLVEREVDLLIVSPATAEALDPAVTRAMSRGIPVILVDRRVTSDNFVSFVTATDWALARFMAQWLAETLNFEGNIVMLPGLAGSSPAENRIKAAHEVFDKYLPASRSSSCSTPTGAPPRASRSCRP